MKRVLALLLAMLMISGVAVFAGCEEKAETTVTEATKTEATKTEATETEATQTDEALIVGILYISPKDDGGYSQAHAEGMAAAKAALGDKVIIKEIENVSDTDVEATNIAIENLVNEGCTLIFTTSYGYMDPTVAAAEKYPDVKFAHCSGYKTNDTNMDAYFGQIETGRYLSGIVAGSMTTTNEIGYVAAYPIPEVVRGINAFTLGVQSVNPEAIVKVVWTNTWYDPAVEKASAEALLADGCDVMAQHQDSPSAIEAAEAAGAYAIGYDLTYAGAPDAYLTAPLWGWGVYYTYKIQQVLDGAWTVENYWGGMKEGVAKLDTLSALVSDEAKAAVEAATADVTENGNAFVFAGPIYDQAGTLKVEEGQSLSYGDQMGMAWFVKGVEGEIPAA